MIFQKEEINGRGLVNPAPLTRWVILRTTSFAIYLHHWRAEEWTPDPHDHPKIFWSIGVWGSYTEKVWRRNIHQELTYTEMISWVAPWVRRFPPEYIHRVVTADNAWSLCIVGRKKKAWGFFPQIPGTSDDCQRYWIDVNTYVRGKWREYEERRE
jgi:hypothetical protein